MALAIDSFGTQQSVTRVPVTLALHLASEKFQQLNAKTAILGPIRDLFLKHKVHKQLGIALLHKHFPIQPTERLVDCRNISAPWDVGDDTEAITQKYDNFILPRSFRLSQGKFVPYEFDFSDTDDLLHQVDQEFLSQLSSLLYQHGLDHLLGIRSLDQHSSELTVEVTEGNMNIMIRRGIVPEDELIEALWVFGKDEDDSCHCREFCRRDNKGEHYENNHACG
ncbi:uncharacterized protein DNG_08007 [Cephalotrichum gorgonifer]|uniref:Uncharacterized protein n=1 Tax=Cephalotrichum gorgonifer TaxID=2041049 RepID=A0AAE8N5S1_9PEZI|nr:uncharacterized protein DNG_08007 [Cephalotrichum gorgonifer]